MNKFDLFLQHLRTKFPTRKRLVVKRVCMKDDGKTTESDRGKITVTINRDMTVQQQIDTLIHEWGHVIEFDAWEPHGKRWGEGMAKAYQEWEKWDET